jgi:hypothetical protein
MPATQDHHFEDLSPDDFESLVYWLAARSGDLHQVQWYGGARDRGRDVVAYRDTPAGREAWYIQAKRCQAIALPTLRDELDELAQHAAHDPTTQPHLLAVSRALRLGPSSDHVTRL